MIGLSAVTRIGLRSSAACSRAWFTRQAGERVIGQVAARDAEQFEALQ